MPRGLRDCVVWGVGFGAQLWAYLLVLTSAYPDPDPAVVLGVNERDHGSADGGQAATMTAHGGAPPERRRQSLAGGDNSHYPSSWYSKAKKPVRPPTNTGSHAAAIGCINSALLKSSVTFDKT